MTLEIAPNGADPLAKLAGLTALEACGYLADHTAAPPPVIAYAKSFAHAVVSIAKTLRLLRTSDPAVVHNALSRLAREGLIPGDVGDATSTGYLFIGKGNVLAAEPNPRGRLACARAAGVEVRAVPIHKDDVISLNGDGDVDTNKSTLKPDPRPTKWDHVKGVMLHVDDLHTGSRRSLWVSASEIGVRKAQAGGQGVWNKDGVSMACTKAIKIAIARGAIPQASLIPSILAACAAPTAPRPLAIEAQPAPRQLAEPAPVAPVAEPDQAPDADDAPDPEPDPGPADEAPPAEPEPEQAAPNYAATLIDDLAAEAECGRVVAAGAVVAAVVALREAGQPHEYADLRAPKIWSRLIERAAQAARADD